MNTLVALPVYNEAAHLNDVLDEVLRYARHILVVDDGSTDGTSDLLGRRRDVLVVRHAKNRGYGAALMTAFQFAADHQFEGLVTIDCDRQHEPKRIPEFINALNGWDLVSGSRYLSDFDGESAPPEDRWMINRMITAELNRRLGLQLTDGFCGFKAYRTEALRGLQLAEPGYAMPLEFWVAAVKKNIRIRELAVPLIYLDPSRSFGGSLDHAQTRLRYYRQVLQESLVRHGLLSAAGTPHPPLVSQQAKPAENQQR